MKERFSLIIAAAGSGKRMNAGKNKVFIEINDKMIIQRTIESFLDIDEIKEIIVLVREEDKEFIKRALSYINKVNIKYVLGGKERQDSIYNALKKVDKNIDFVIVHDGARPFIKKNIIIETMEKAIENDFAIVAVRSKDTIKIVRESEVISTLDRSELWMAQTPQIFKFDTIKEVYEKSIREDVSATDDASLMEHYGYNVNVVEGYYSNIKVTTEEDRFFAKAIIEMEV
ncbi:2-C-methyl-D-erythritol 4-phosphate cytidylyltransferase [Helicovermis profundi]|uniref:2-C-methyl-D-erythritol 4-phosphate cytidylyltransferase n=1 Tax=Helicovermis profundi TaxID=3065157 RepID=A0AAU9EBG0_9FIRM|nr:2-C-methyl-D-erythritol 4-phosphate cytidylyltransferase [Clostridia bacterium S502]